MNYLSDDEENDNIIAEPTLDDLYPQDELDEETLAIIRKHANNSSIDDLYISSGTKEVKEKKEKPKKQKVVKSIEQLIKEEEEKKPKKWKSSRAENKKKSTDEVTKRHFNPRLPPYRTLDKKKDMAEKVEYSEDSFPSLMEISLKK